MEQRSRGTSTASTTYKVKKKEDKGWNQVVWICESIGNSHYMRQQRDPHVSQTNKPTPHTEATPVAATGHLGERSGVW